VLPPDVFDSCAIADGMFAAIISARTAAVWARFFIFDLTQTTRITSRTINAATAPATGSIASI